MTCSSPDTNSGIGALTAPYMELPSLEPGPFGAPPRSHLPTYPHPSLSVLEDMSSVSNIRFPPPLEADARPSGVVKLFGPSYNDVALPTLIGSIKLDSKLLVSGQHITHKGDNGVIFQVLGAQGARRPFNTDALELN